MVVPQAVTHYPHDSCRHLRIDLHGEVQSIIAYFLYTGSPTTTPSAFGEGAFDSTRDNWIEKRISCVNEYIRAFGIPRN